jgi:hypothetical protein
LAAGSKWAFFPSVAVGWNLHNETFMKGLTVLNEFKIRASYGLSGNQAIAVGATKATLGITNAVVDQGVRTGYVQSNMANDKLHWENTKQTNIGMDLSFFNNKLDFEFNYYNKRSVDLLIALVIPPSNGFTRYNTNLGTVENHGYEFDLGVKPLTGPLQWNVSGNFSINRNKIINLGGVQSFVGPTQRLAIRLVRSTVIASMVFTRTRRRWTTDLSILLPPNQADLSMWILMGIIILPLRTEKLSVTPTRILFLASPTILPGRGFPYPYFFREVLARM